MRVKTIRQGLKEFRYWLWHLFSQPIFLFVTLWGHLSIFGGALGFYYFESPVNSKVPSFLHSYYWAISTATTVGSDINPITDQGKLVAIFMMVAGSLFLWSYTALFAASLVATDVKRVEKDMEDIEEEIKEEREVDKASYESLQMQLEEIKKLLKK